MQTATANPPTDTLFDQRRDESIDARFAAFDAAHPEIWNLFCRFIDELRRAGRTRYSADAILHRIRWHYAVNEQRDDGFKVNDWYSSRYARKAIAADPSLSAFFETRALKDER